MIKVINSATGIVDHNPFIPNTFGRIDRLINTNAKLFIIDMVFDILA